MEKKLLQSLFQKKLLNAIYAIPNGIFRMSPDIDGLVQTSNNLARIIADDGNYSIQCLARSSADTEKEPTEILRWGLTHEYKTGNYQYIRRFSSRRVQHHTAPGESSE